MPSVILTSPKGNARLERWLQGGVHRVLTPVKPHVGHLKENKIPCLKQMSGGSAS